MKISELPNAPQWLLDARTANASVEWDSNDQRYIVWRGGVWRGGVWRGGEWRGGEWRGGVWRGEKLTSNLWTVLGLRWPITISQTRMQVGCEVHPFTEWISFTDERINKMDRGALKFWRTHKDHLMALCATREGTNGGTRKRCLIAHG